MIVYNFMDYMFKKCKRLFDNYIIFNQYNHRFNLHLLDVRKL